MESIPNPNPNPSPRPNPNPSRLQLLQPGGLLHVLRDVRGLVLQPHEQRVEGVLLPMSIAIGVAVGVGPEVRGGVGVGVGVEVAKGWG